MKKATAEDVASVTRMLNNERAINRSVENSIRRDIDALRRESRAQYGSLAQLRAKVNSLDVSTDWCEFEIKEWEDGVWSWKFWDLHAAESADWPHQRGQASSYAKARRVLAQEMLAYSMGIPQKAEVINL